MWRCVSESESERGIAAACADSRGHAGTTFHILLLGDWLIRPSHSGAADEGCVDRRAEGRILIKSNPGPRIGTQEAKLATLGSGGAGNAP